MRSGYYRLIPAEAEAIAKRDEYLVKVDIISMIYLQVPDIFRVSLIGIMEPPMIRVMESGT